MGVPELCVTADHLSGGGYSCFFPWWLCCFVAQYRRSRNESQLEEEEQTSKKIAPSAHAEEYGIEYQPKTRETRQSYEVLLTFILNCIGDQVCVLWVCRMCLSCMYVNIQVDAMYWKNVHCNLILFFLSQGKFSVEQLMKF